MEQAKYVLSKYMMVMAFFLFSAIAGAQANLSIEGFNIKGGQTGEMLIDLTNNSIEITLVQFDLRLADGLSIVKEEGEFAIDIAGRTTWKKHSLDANATDGIVRFLLSSTKNSALEGSDGAIISVKISAGNDFKGGDIKLENILLVSPDQTEIKQETYTYSIKPQQEEPTGITVLPTSKTINVGESFKLSYTLTPSNATSIITWYSEDSNVATVDNDGKVTGVKVGTTTITVKTANGKTASCKVVVESQPISNAIKIDATNFPDENFRKYLSEQDYGKDGVITPDEISTIYGISCGEMEISNLKGIEFFSSLKFLYCDFNQLTSLDVSKNINLTELSCGFNQLTSLDVSKNINLTELSCDLNQLTSLDVSKNINLTELSCNFNQLTTLDITKNTNFKTLSCFGNQLSSLDVSKNTDLAELYCGSNRLTSLDVSKNNNLTLIWCYDNKIGGSAMDDLISCLPRISSNDGLFYVVNNPDTDGNVCTKTQVAAAKAKGWISYYYNGGWVEYEGSDPNSIDGIMMDELAGAPIYNLNGQRIDKPHKGINIIGGKKVVIK